MEAEPELTADLRRENILLVVIIVLLRNRKWSER